jgi:hypothetical protein
VLFTFPSRYLCTIGRQRVFRLRGWSPYVQTGFHVPRPTQGSSEALRLRGYHPLWPTFPGRSASLLITTGLLRFRSPLLAESLLMSFPTGTEMFQFPGFASYAYVFSIRYSLRSGFPHSEIRGSTIARISPRLIAACHVLHRLLAPRHPPNALFLLILTTTVRAQDQTAPGFHPADPPHKEQQRHILPKLHTHWMTHPPPSPKLAPETTAADPSSTKSYSPFKRTCPNPRQSPGRETVEGSRHSLSAAPLSRKHRPTGHLQTTTTEPTTKAASHPIWRLTDSNR